MKLEFFNSSIQHIVLYGESTILSKHIIYIFGGLINSPNSSTIAESLLSKEVDKVKFNFIGVTRLILLEI